MPRPWPLAVAALLLACGHDAPLLVTRPADPPREIVIRNVRVFEASEAYVLPGLRDVLVRGDTIAAVASPVIVAPGAVEIDGTGGTLVPGLVDMHTHTGSTAGPPTEVGTLPDVDANLASFLYAGVTTVLDLGNLAPAVFATRDEVARGERLGPRMYAAGPVFTAPGGHPAEVLHLWLPWYLRWYVVPRATREVATPEEARRAVEALAAERPDILKITVDAGATGDVPCLPREVIAAITAAGHAARIRSIAHIGSSAEAIAVVESGVDALAHSPWREDISDEAVAAIAAAHVPVVPTLAVWDLSGTPRAAEADFLPIERAVAPAGLIPQLLAPPPDPDAFTRAHMRVASANAEARRRNVVKLRAASVTILVGSDGSNPGQLPGAGIHLEMAKLVAAGMAPGEVLRAATWENSRFLGGATADYGEIAAGKRADLVLVDGDPTADIGALARIRQVILGGVVLSRASR